MTRQLPALAQPFFKGHGAENDFLVLPDPGGRLLLSEAEIRRLCDRRTGLGADGLLRAVRCAADPEATELAAGAEWFMDYRNADGSLGAMCGNGIRVFARTLVHAGLARSGALVIATRAGARRVHVPPPRHGRAGMVRVEMGRPQLPGPDGIEVTVAGRCWPAVHVDVGNPHAVVFVDDLAHAGDLTAAPVVTPATVYPAGVTTNFVTAKGPGQLVVRTHERGVGETRACGTGACAAVAATIATHSPSAAGQYTVDTQGGRLYVAVQADGAMELVGPAVVVAQGAADVTSGWCASSVPAQRSPFTVRGR